MRMSFIAVLALLCPVAAAAQAISLSKPVQCTVGKDCFIQNYVDQDTTAGHGDYACGSLSYNKHTGTDFRLPNMAAMRRGVAVIAAADGTVRSVRDSMPDITVNAPGQKEKIINRECGNGVAVNHPAGFETRYCHLRQGSIIVKQGDKVKAGQKLGLIGLSGATEFPHLHFGVYRLGRALDPFTAEPIGTPCGKARSSLWNAATAASFAYQATALLGAGFYPAEPKAEVIREQAAPVTSISRTAPVLSFWGELMGPRQGDILTMSVLAPNGVELVKREIPYTKHQAQIFVYVGKRTGEEGIAPGEYTGKIELKRPGQADPIVTYETKVNVPY